MPLENLLDDSKNLGSKQEPSLSKEIIKAEEMHWFVEDPRRADSFDHKPLSMEEWVDDEIGGLESVLRPKVKETLSNIFAEPEKYQEIILDWGIGTGKSFLAGAAITYLLHRLLCLKNPHAYFGLAEGTPIAIMNMSFSASQAKKIVFGAVKGRVEGASWFRDHDYLPDPRIQSELRFPKGIEVIPGNSKEMMPAGVDLYIGGLDEASWHIVTKEKDYAEEAYNTMRTRSNSRFPGVGKVIIISSPRHVHDFIETKMEKEKDNPRVYTSRIASWESPAPTLILSGKTFVFDIEAKRIISDQEETGNLNTARIPIEYREDFERDPARAWRDLGAQPSKSIESYYPDSQVVERNTNRQREDPWDIRLNKFKDDFKPEMFPRARYIHIDLAQKKDACGLAMGREDGTVVVNGEARIKVYIDIMIQIKAPPGKEILFSDVRQLIYDIRDRGFPIAQVSYDGWQSIDSIQILNQQNIKAELLSVDRTVEPHETLKSCIQDNRIDYYEHQVFIDEIQGLELVKGEKVDHSPKGSKDVADAMAGVAFWICQKPAVGSFSKEADKNVEGPSPITRGLLDKKL